MRFRKNLSRLGEILSYEMSKRLTYEVVPVTTPLSDTMQPKLKEQPVLIPILRAAMPFFEGVQNFFDHADCGFIGAYRAPTFDQKKDIKSDYFAVPDLSDRTVVLIDPMLATGHSIVAALKELKKFGTPKEVILLTLIAAPEGISYIEEQITGEISLWCIAVDEKLNDKAYIVPGLGDAGDLAYGLKI